MVGHAVEDAAHHHRDAGRRQIGLEYGGAIGRREHRFGEVAADLAGVGVDRQHELHVGRAVAADHRVDQAPRGPRGIGIKGDALHERARAIADANQRDLDLFHHAPVISR
jgi:hypothetical protein